MKTTTYYTAKDLARILGLSRPTVALLINQGKIEAYRFGRKYSITKTQIDNFMEKSKVSNIIKGGETNGNVGTSEHK